MLIYFIVYLFLSEYRRFYGTEPVVTGGNMNSYKTAIKYYVQGIYIVVL